MDSGETIVWLRSDRCRFRGIVLSSSSRSRVTWEDEASPTRYTFGSLGTRLSGAPAGCIASGGSGRGAGTGRPDASVYVQFFDAK